MGPEAAAERGSAGPRIPFSRNAARYKSSLGLQGHLEWIFTLYELNNCTLPLIKVSSLFFPVFV